MEWMEAEDFNVELEFCSFILLGQHYFGSLENKLPNNMLPKKLRQRHRKRNIWCGIILNCCLSNLFWYINGFIIILELLYIIIIMSIWNNYKYYDLCRCLRRRRLDLWCHILVAGAAQRNINRWMRIGDWPSSHVMRIMSVELLTPARLVIEYPIMHYYGIPNDITYMYDCDWVFLGIPVQYCMVGMLLIIMSYLYGFAKKGQEFKVLLKNLSTFSHQRLPCYLSVHDLELNWDKREKTQCTPSQSASKFKS